MLLILFYLSILVWQLFLASLSMSIFPLCFLKRRFFSLNFFSSCWWVVLKIVNPQGIPKAQGGVLLLCWPWEVGGSHGGKRGGHIIVWLVCLAHILSSYLFILVKVESSCRVGRTVFWSWWQWPQYGKSHNQWAF